MSKESGEGAAVFDTELGSAVIVWSEGGVLELRLPDPADGLRRAGPLPSEVGPGDGRALAPLAGRGPPIAAVRRMPAWLQGVSRRIASHLAGRLDDFLDVPLDLPRTASRFDLDIWRATREVPPGLTISYGELAEEAGHPGAARAAGSSLRRSPVALLIPAHRVIAAGGRPGGWTGGAGVATKLWLLSIEGVQLRRGR